MNRLVWQPYMVEDGRIIDGTVHAEPIEDLAVIARIGGNEYRRLIVLGRLNGRPDDLDRFAKSGAEGLAANTEHHRGHYSDPWAWTDTEGVKHLTPASYSGCDIYASPRSFAVPLPESAFSWPVYLAAMIQTTDDCQSRGHREYEYGPPEEDGGIEQYQRESR